MANNYFTLHHIGAAKMLTDLLTSNYRIVALLVTAVLNGKTFTSHDLTMDDLEIAVGGDYANHYYDTIEGTISTVNDVTQLAFPAYEWVFGGPLSNATNKTIKGYVLTVQEVQNGSLTLLCGASVADFTPTNDGDKFKVTPVFKLGNTNEAAIIGP